MLRAGFPVPPGFVIGIDAFVGHFSEVTDPLVKPNVPRLQPELMAEVVQALMDYLGEEGQVAVRSSSTEEDSSHASFAGQHSTYYFVPPNRIDQAIVDCWMSLWTPAALSYRRAGWSEITSGDPVRMAVIVQQMLPATRSGVVFSRDPIDSASSDSVIECSWGLGAALVDGRVSPDHARVTEHGALLSYSTSDKQFQVSASPTNHDAHRLQEVAREKRNAAVLSGTEAEHIANISQQLETLFEAPQDVEWAYVNDQLYLLQSRPITTRPQYHDIDQKLVLFKPLAENFTEPLTPLTQDLFAAVMPDIGALYEGRFYLDLELIERLSIFELSEAELVDLALLRTAPDSLKFSWRKTLTALALMSVAFLADGANWIRTTRASFAALGRYTALIEKVRNSSKYTPLSALRRLIWGRHPFEPIGYHMLYTNVSAGRYFFYIGLLQALVRRFAPDYPLSELSRTYHGSEDMRSMSLLNELDHLANVLHEGLDADDENSEQIREVLTSASNTLPPHARFTVEFEAFLNRYGHRGPREMEMAAPSWREAPASLLKMLHSSVPNPDRATTTYGTHLAARDELHGHLKPWQRNIVDRIRRKIGKYIELRENTRHYHIMAFDLVRQKILEQEQALLHQGKLRVSGDIFFLHNDEIDALQSEQLDPRAAHDIVRKRRRDWQRQARVLAPEAINTEHHTPVPSADGLVGQCACPGYVEADARVIHSLSEADTLLAGEILVAPYTDPAWTPLFTRAGGIIVGTGSFLSHAGTVARELQVPCIVDVKHCMQQITTGQRLRVDASNGTVEILT